MKEIKLLGLQAKDKVTGFTGVVTSIAFDLYGCIQAIVTPEVKTESNSKDDTYGRWFDVKRLNILGTDPVMEVPNFELPVAGPEPKPRIDR